MNSERQRQQDDLRQQQQREDLVGEVLRARLRPPVSRTREIGRHIGGVEGAFAEDGAEMIGQAQGDDEGVHHQARAQHAAEHDVAHEAR